MKGFSIYVKNDLLEPKHIQNMDAAVWLYLWLLDKMTSVNENGIGKVLGNQPITYSLVKAELGITERTYQRWVAKLRETGYINTLRTPHGLCFSVTKANKRFKKSSAKSVVSRSATNGVSELEVIRQKVHSDPPNVVERSAKKEDVNKDLTKTTQDYTSITNVIGANAPPTFGKQDINFLFDYWQSVTGIKIQGRVQANRNACNNLVKRYEVDGVKRLIDGVVLAQSDKFAPRISDFTDLQAKLNQLLTWGKAQTQQRGTIKI